MIAIRPMVAADISLGMRLREQAGWNQTAADWQRFFDLEPHGCFCAELSGDPVGTVTTCVFDRVGWIGMLLVDEAARGRGVGKALMQEALGYLAVRGVDSCRLDATPSGQPLYEKLVYTRQFSLSRFGGTAQHLDQHATADLLRDADLPPVSAVDASVVTYDRRRLLVRLYEEARDRALVVREADADSVVGFALARPGARATQIGPCIALHADAGCRLLSSAFQSARGNAICIDVPHPNRAAMAMARSWGLTPQRELVRMCRGEPALERVDCLWASSGPEKG
jgi:ribosomal protein S18 acetylase RimI-like enzyme